MLKFKTSCAVLAYLSSNLLNEIGLSLFRYFEVGLRVCDIVVKSLRSLSYLLMSSCILKLAASKMSVFVKFGSDKYHKPDQHDKLTHSRLRR